MSIARPTDGCTRAQDTPKDFKDLTQPVPQGETENRTKDNKKKILKENINIFSINIKSLNADSMLEIERAM